MVMIDPPRKGCSAQAVSVINKLDPDKLVYISCDPATLARDASRLRDGGWILRRFAAVDMFPRTANVETVALFTRREF